MTKNKKKQNLEKLLSGYFEFSVPIVSAHFISRWMQRFGNKSPESLFRLVKRSEVCMLGDKFELYDVETNIRLSYEYKDDGNVVFISIFNLDDDFKDNWLDQIKRLK